MIVVVNVEVGVLSDCTVCRPDGDLDIGSVPAFKEEVTPLTDSGRLVLDLSEVSFLDSSGLGALVGIIRRTRDAGGTAAVVCSRSAVLRLLSTTGFDRLVPVVPTLDEAISVLVAESDDDGVTSAT